MTKQLIAFLAFAFFIFGQVHGDCRDYTYDDCTAPGPFERIRDLGTEEVCQQYCNEIYDGTDENPRCQFYIWDNLKKDCRFFDYPIANYTNSCDGVAGTPLPGLENCQDSTDECLKFKEGYCQYDEANTLENFYGYDLKKCETACKFDTRCKHFVHKKNAMSRDPMVCQLRSSKNATCDLEIGPSTPTKDEACFGACKDIDYALLSDPKRNRDFNGGFTVPPCDSTGAYVQGDWKGGDVWYRFVEPAGNQLADSIVPQNHCGTSATGWLNGEHPQTLGGNVTREVCFNYAGNSCWQRTDVEIKKCFGFFLYKFKSVPRCGLKYCGQ